METEAGKVALYAVECAPEIGGEGMGVMQDDRRDVEPLREVSTATKTNARPFRPCRDPCESKVGDKVIAPVLLDHPVLSPVDIILKTQLLYQFYCINKLFNLPRPCPRSYPLVAERLKG